MMSGRENVSETKIAALEDVREHGEGEPVELWLNRSGRVVLRAFNECRNNHTDVDLSDLLEWTRAGCTERRLADVGLAALSASERD